MRTCTQVYKLVHMHSYPQVHKDMLPQMPLCKYTCIHPHTHIGMYRHMCIQVCILTHMHMCAHTGVYNTASPGS